MYKNIVSEGDIHRLNYKNGIDAYIDRLKSESNSKRTEFMNPDNFKENIEAYYEEWAKIGTINEDSDYLDLFANSKAKWLCCISLPRSITTILTLLP